MTGMQIAVALFTPPVTVLLIAWFIRLVDRTVRRWLLAVMIAATVLGGTITAAAAAWVAVSMFLFVVTWTFR